MSYGSPQGIAALYRGNPGALDARIKEEQQAKPGMPPDLAKLLALQIDVNEQDAVKRQQAMAALQGMQQQAPTGKPPTVAESLQQLALQKARQVAVQQQQQQKGLQALLGQTAPTQTPERPPQPERQGSIEELQSNLGQEYAGGGIVAFAEGDVVEDDTPLWARPLRAAKQKAAEALEAERERNMRLARAEGENLRPTMANDPRMLKIAASEMASAPAETAPAAPARDLAQLAKQKQQVATPSAPTSAPAGIATPAESDRNKFLAAQYAQTPAQRREEALKRYAEQVGGPDTAAQEAYIKALQGRVGGMDTEKDLYGRIGDYARKLATAGGRTSLQTGANASGMIEAERLANEQKKFDLLKEIMGESTKVADTKRGYKKEVLAFGEKEYDDAYKNAFDAAKEQGLDDREAKKLAHQAAEGRLNRANALAVANIRADVAGGNADMKATQQAEAAFARDPEAAAIKKMLESPLYSMNPAKAAPLLSKLRAIQASKYAQFGLTMEPAPGAASPGGTPADINALLKKYGGK